MGTLFDTTPGDLTLADAFARFGPMPLARLRLEPRPGTATVADVIRIHDEEGLLCELADGVLVEKAMGATESMYAWQLAFILGTFVRQHHLGVMTGEAGMLELSPGLVRIPDLAFISRARYATADRTRGAWRVVPDLAVDILSRSNTSQEMERKLADYFQSQVREVWYVDLERRVLDVYWSVLEMQSFREDAQFADSRVLPGFVLNLKDVFADPGA